MLSVHLLDTGWSWIMPATNEFCGFAARLLEVVTTFVHSH